MLVKRSTPPGRATLQPVCENCCGAYAVEAMLHSGAVMNSLQTWVPPGDGEFGCPTAYLI